jgi:hypothetical protein
MKGESRKTRAVVLNPMRKGYSARLSCTSTFQVSVTFKYCVGLSCKFTFSMIFGKKLEKRELPGPTMKL